MKEKEISKNPININNNEKNLKSPSKLRGNPKEKSIKEDNKITSVNKIVTVDLRKEDENSSNKKPKKSYINTKVVNLDLFSSSESNRSFKNLNNCKSENHIDSDDNKLKKKFIHVPTVETKLYSDEHHIESSEKQTSRNSSISLLNARSNRKKITSSTNDSLNESQESYGDRFNISNLNQQLNEIKSFKRKVSQNDGRSLSPMKLEPAYDNSKIEINKRNFSQDPHNYTLKNTKINYNNIFNFNSDKKSLSFLNYVRSHMKSNEQQE